ncbi:MAG: Holliday junction branch migration protein RuvA [bacterium]|nr:Holliday junction branch migration protein RuvA [bacterium]
MISLLRGPIIDTGTRMAILDIHGVGYKVYVTDDTLNYLKIGVETTFFTYLVVREDALDLYGFLSKNEKAFFELLISVSGIGPKSALNILSLVSNETLASSIRTGSAAHLVKVSGIGRKTAEKIVLELKDKMGGMTGSEMTVGMSSDMDAIEALRALGYETDEAREALKNISKDIEDTGAKVKAALKELGK